MKILHLNDHYERVGGAETVLFHLLDALEEQGVENIVLHQHPTTIQENRRRVYHLSHLGDVHPPQEAQVPEKFRQILNQEKPDLIHIHDIGNPQIAQMSLHYGPTAQSVFNHSYYCPGGLKYLPLRKKVCERPFGLGCIASAYLTHCNSIRSHLLFSSYRRSDEMLRQSPELFFIASSRYQADCLIQSGCPGKNVAVLPPFTDLPDLPFSQHHGSEKPVLLFTGRLVWGKGLDLLLRSLRFIRSSFQLIIVGDGPELAKAKKLTSVLGVDDRVRFVGWALREEHLGYYAKASVVVVPSVWPEPFGMVGIEAMSYAKPVVAFRVGGIPEWLEDEKTGFLIPPGNLKEMAEKINFLLENPTIAREMGAQGREKVEMKFCKANYMTSLLKIYEGVQQS